jgi:hypothetical protein
MFFQNLGRKLPLPYQYQIENATVSPIIDTGSWLDICEDRQRYLDNLSP